MNARPTIEEFVIGITVLAAIWPKTEDQRERDAISTARAVLSRWVGVINAPR